MANNKMFLVNKRTGVKIYLAKYYPSTGWFSILGSEKKLDDGFDKSDFGHLTPEEQALKDGEPGFGPFYANYPASHLHLGDQWELEYESVSQVPAPNTVP